jgi:hypothetical protein
MIKVRRDPADCGKQRNGEMAVSLDRLALDVGEEAKLMAVGRDDARPIERAHRLRHRHAKPSCERLHRAVLQLELGARERGVRNLEDVARFRSVDSEVEVLVAPEIRGRAVDPEPAPRQLERFRGGHLRVPQLVVREGIRRHRERR